MKPAVVIPAAGLGTRMNDLTKTKPKCLINIDGKTILEHQLRMLSTLDIYSEDIYVVIGTTGECWTQESYNRIREIHNNIIVNFENKRKKPAFTLRLGFEETAQKSVVILDGDVILNREVLKSLIENENRSAIISKTVKNRGEPGSKVVTNDDGVIEDIGKEIQPNNFPWHIYAGISKIEGKELDALEQTLQSESISNMDVADVLRYVARKESLFNLEFNDGWVNMNRPEDVDKAEKLIL